MKIYLQIAGLYKLLTTGSCGYISCETTVSKEVAIEIVKTAFACYSVPGEFYQWLVECQ